MPKHAKIFVEDIGMAIYRGNYKFVSFQANKGQEFYFHAHTFVSMLMVADNSWPERSDRMALVLTSMLFKHRRAPIKESMADDGFATRNLTFASSILSSLPKIMDSSSSFRLCSWSFTPFSSLTYAAADCTIEFLSPYKENTNKLH